MTPVHKPARLPLGRGYAAVVLSLALLTPILYAACAPRELAKVEDSIPPTVRIISPADGARVQTATPTIEIEYDDQGSGVASVSFRATINGADYSTAFDHHSRGATGRVPSPRPLPLGKNRLVVEVPDRAGNLGRAEVTFWNASGGWLRVGFAPGAEPRRTFELILDASGSMKDRVGTGTRMAVAKDAVKSLIGVLPAGIPLGLRVYRDCRDIVSAVPIRPVDKAAFVKEVEKVEPVGGTPLVASLLESLQALSRIREGERVSVIVTDGGESCNGSIPQVISRARETATRIVVIGVDVGPGEAQQMQAIADGSGGAFVKVDASDPGRLLKALERAVLRVGYHVLDAAGRRVAEGDVDGDQVELPLGTYQVELATLPPVTIPGIPIGSLTETTVQLRRTAGRLAGDVRGPVPAPGTN